MLRKAAFLVGLFVLCACVLILQIVATRVLSVISFYHLAFFAISMAMFGLTAGSLIIYFNQGFFAPERLLAHLSWIAAAFALAVVLSTVVLISTVLLNWPMRLVLWATLWLKLIAALVPPYIFAGMGGPARMRVRSSTRIPASGAFSLMVISCAWRAAR